MSIVRYFFVGGCAAAVDFVLFAVAVRYFSVPWLPAAVFSFVVATAVNYLLSIAFVFQSGIRFSKGWEWLLVFAVSGFGLALDLVILWVLIESAGIHMLVAKVLATGGVFLWNYGIRRYFIFSAAGLNAP